MDDGSSAKYPMTDTRRAQSELRHVHCNMCTPETRQGWCWPRPPGGGVLVPRYAVQIMFFVSLMTV